MRVRVLAAVQDLGYRPNAIARSLRKTGTKTIGLVVSDLMNPFFAELARSVEDAARKLDLNVIVGNADEDPGQQDRYIQILLERQVDGLLVVPTEETSTLLHEAAQRDAPIILVDRPARDVNAPVVRADGDQAIADLMTHLKSLGHERIGMIAGPELAGTGRQRLTAARESAARVGLDLPTECIVRGTFRVESGEAAMAHLLDLPAPPQVVFAANGQMGQGAIMEARRRRVSWPEPVGLCVFDDLPWFELLEPGITAISQPVAEIGELAVEMLLRRLAGDEVGDQYRPCRLHIRASCGEELNGR
jgi:LacI family transcriptional regulator